MKVLLKSATIVDATSKHHLKKRDVLINNGLISKIAAKIDATHKVKEVTLKNLHISQGWFDPSVSFGEPGYEERETLSNGLLTAGYSGFTDVAVNANTHPVTDSKGNIKYLLSQAERTAVHLHVIGALTVKAQGTDLAELFDMHSEGAIAFYDYKKSVANANLLKIALQYAQGFNGLIQSFPHEASVALKGMVNEEEQSTRLGLKGIPALSEELQIIRDLYILEYTGGKLHIPTISTAKSVALIRDAKKKGLQVSCSVSVANLALTDDVLDTFDTNYKLLPPLRTQKDIKALIKGLKDGTINGVTSDHNPIDIEHKNTEFDHALFGSIGLESCFGALHNILSLEETITALTRLRTVFGIAIDPIEEGAAVRITLFNPDLEYTFSEAEILSSSKNAAFLGKSLKGKAYGICANKRILIHE